MFSIPINDQAICQVELLLLRPLSLFAFHSIFGNSLWEIAFLIFTTPITLDKSMYKFVIITVCLLNNACFVSFQY